jgi:hypothetical protein
MVLPHVFLRLPPEVVVVLALDDVAAHARDLLHALIVREESVRLESSTKGSRNGRLRLSPQHDRKERYVMATFAVIAEHPPHLCPTSNAQTRQMLKEGAGQIPQLAAQLGIDIGTLRIFGPDHIILFVLEADDIDSVRNFSLQSGLMQWNTVKIHATYSIEEAVSMIDDVEAIF